MFSFVVISLFKSAIMSFDLLRPNYARIEPESIICGVKTPLFQRHVRLAATPSGPISVVIQSNRSIQLAVVKARIVASLIGCSPSTCRVLESERRVKDWLGLGVAQCRAFTRMRMRLQHAPLTSVDDDNDVSGLTTLRNGEYRLWAHRQIHRSRLSVIYAGKNNFTSTADWPRKKFWTTNE